MVDLFCEEFSDIIIYALTVVRGVNCIKSTECQEDTIVLYYWASAASPTLGCSIEISRDIYICCRYVVCLSYVKLTA